MISFVKFRGVEVGSGSICKYGKICDFCWRWIDLWLLFLRKLRNGGGRFICVFVCFCNLECFI